MDPCIIYAIFLNEAILGALGSLLLCLGMLAGLRKIVGKACRDGQSPSKAHLAVLVGVVASTLVCVCVEIYIYIYTSIHMWVGSVRHEVSSMSA